MIDFSLNSNGDIDFIQSNKKSASLQFDFLIAESNALRFNFFCEDEVTDGFLESLEPGLIFNIYIDNIEYDKEISMTESNEDLLYQKFKIRLDSVKGTILNNEDIGSTLDNYRHRLLNSEKENKDLEEIKQNIYESIKDIAPNATINVKKIDTIYADYSNSLMITIYVNDFNYYYYL